MNKIKERIYQFLLFILLIYVFILRSCGSHNIKSTKQVKLVKQFDTIKIFSEPITKFKTKYINIEGKTKYLPGKIDTIKIKSFEFAKDSVKFNMFTDAIKIRQYKQDFNDSIADVSIFVETEGKLLKMAPTITVKARFPAIETKFALYLSGGTYSNVFLKNSGFNIGLGFQNKKGDIFRGSYDPINKNVFVNYDLRILNIKK